MENPSGLSTPPIAVYSSSSWLRFTKGPFEMRVLRFDFWLQRVCALVVFMEMPELFYSTGIQKSMESSLFLFVLYLFDVFIQVHSADRTEVSVWTVRYEYLYHYTLNTHSSYFALTPLLGVHNQISNPWKSTSIKGLAMCAVLEMCAVLSSQWTDVFSTERHREEQQQGKRGISRGQRRG